MNATIATYTLAPAQNLLDYPGKAKNFFRGLFVVIFSSFLAASPCAADSGEQDAGLAQTKNTRPLLNSERIKQKYGSYGIDVLEDDGAVRVSSLYSTEGSKKITRTLAVVIYPEEIPKQLQHKHQAIRDGGSMGEVFTRSGWQVEKENLYFGEIRASPDFAEIYSLMGDLEATNLAVHVYRLSVCREGSCFVYATLSEVHHPDYLGLAELKEVYGGSGIAPVQASERDREENSNRGGERNQDIQQALSLTLAALAAQ